MSDTKSDRDALAALTATHEELRMKLGGTILTLGHRPRSRQRLTVRPLEACTARILSARYDRRYPPRPVGGAPVDAPPGRLALLSGASITAGVVTTADGITVAESLAAMSRDDAGPFSSDRRGNLYQAKPRFARRRQLGAAPAVLLTVPGDGDYRHWLTEALPRLALVEDHFDLRTLIIIVSGPTAMAPIYRDSLALFGIGAEQIILTADETLVPDTLIYPLPGAGAPAAALGVAVLEHLATRVRVDFCAPPRLYVRDHSAGALGLVNEAEVIAAAERHGFAVVEPATLSLYRQIGLFGHARMVVGPAGPALAGALWSNEDLTLISFVAAGRGNDRMAALMACKRGRYRPFEGVASAGDAATTRVTIDVAHLDATLAALIDPSKRA